MYDKDLSKTGRFMHLIDLLHVP